MRKEKIRLIVVISVILLFSFNTVLAAQEKGKGEKGKVPPEIAWTYEFPYKIKSMAMGPGSRWIVVASVSTEETATPRSYVHLFKKNGNIEWKYPLDDYVLKVAIATGGSETPIEGAVKVAVLTDKELIVFNKKGEILWKISPVPTRDFDMSENGEYIVIGDFETTYLGLYNKNGKFLWEKFDYEGYPFVTKNGGCIGLRGSEGIGGPSAVYNRKGEFMWDTDEDSWIEIVSKDGNNFVVCQSLGFSRILMSLVDKNKNILWKKNLRGFTWGISISEDGNYTLIPQVGTVDGEQNKVILCNKQGEVLWEKYNVNFPCILSSNGNYITYTKNAQKLGFMDCIGTEMWEIDFPENVEGVNLSEKGKYVIVNTKRKLYFIKNTAIPEGIE